MAVVVPELNELFEEAYERAGLEMRSGYDLKTARRSLNIMTLEWQNRGLNLFTIEAGTIPLVAGTATYTLPSDTIDLIEHQLPPTESLNPPYQSFGFQSQDSFPVMYPLRFPFLL